MPFKQFDTKRLKLKPLAERQHDMHIDEIAPLQPPRLPLENPDLDTIAQRIVAARERNAAVLILMGAHVIKTGLSRFIIDLLEKGFVTHVGLNGAGAIHDFELSMIGATTESVARYISEGQFGLWHETGRINDIAMRAFKEGLGLGEALGREIQEGEYPHKDVSILAAGYRHQVPVTVHVGLGQDIIHEHPNCDGAALGATSIRDFLILANTVENLEGGVFLNIGTAVMGPEVYLKALSMARNVAHQEGRVIRHFTTAVFDLQRVSSKDFSREPAKSEPEYYHRFWKTVLVRTVRDGGESFYIEGDHRQTIPTLWAKLNQKG